MTSRVRSSACSALVPVVFFVVFVV